MAPGSGPGSGRASTRDDAGTRTADHERQRPPGDPVPQPDVPVRWVEDRMVSLRIAGSNRPRRPPRGRWVDEGADPGHRARGRPSPDFDRSEPADLQMLCAGGRRPVRGVVDRHHQESRALAHHLPGDRREAVLEADRHADGRQTPVDQRMDLLPGRPVHRHLVGRIDERELANGTARTRRTGRDGPSRSGPP